MARNIKLYYLKGLKKLHKKALSEFMARLIVIIVFVVLFLTFILFIVKPQMYRIGESILDKIYEIF